METAKITLTNTPENFLLLAEKRGYQTKVKNPDYVPAQGNEFITDPTWEQPEDFDPIETDTPTVPNPDYVPAVGEPFMDNPVSPVQYVVNLEQDRIARDIAEDLMAIEETKIRAQLAIQKEEAKNAVLAGMTNEIK